MFFSLLLAAGPAVAATPQEVYRDLADNGRLDRKYSRADVNRALRNPSIPGYARAERVMRAPQSLEAPTVAPAEEGAGALPFSGLDLALFAAVGAPLLLLAGSVRHLARPKATES
ncbi:MAG TPA: hypothetical protein VFL41_04335 [Gaiellaceae bacterium]|nr:hypothetical protein [Gaiellaceae bacterium]